MPTFLPQAQIEAPRNAFINFAPLTQAIAEANRNAFLRDQQQLERERFGLEKERMGMEREQFAAQREAALAKKFGALVQALDALPPDQQETAWGKLRSTVPNFDDNMIKYGVDPNDRKLASTFLLNQAGLHGYKLEEEAARAKLGLLGAQTQQARAAAEESTADAAYKRAQAANVGEGAYKDLHQRSQVEAELRKEYTGLNKEFMTVRDASRQIEEIAKQPSAASDVALVYSFMKILDPTSVVRESEYATAQNAAGVPDQVRNLWNRVLNGERLNDAQRADFVNQARTVYAVRERGYQGAQQNYRGIAERLRVDPRNVVLDLNATGAAPSRAGPSAGPAAVPPGWGMQQPRYRAINPATGEVIEWDGMQWRPVQ